MKKQFVDKTAQLSKRKQIRAHENVKDQAIGAKIKADREIQLANEKLRVLRKTS